jgi:hypothetical protein
VLGTTIDCLLPSASCRTPNKEYGCFHPARDVCAPPGSEELSVAAAQTYLAPPGELTGLTACNMPIITDTVTCTD